MFEGLTGALSNMFSGGFTQGLTNMGQAANLIGKAANGQVSDEDKTAWKGLMSGTGSASNPTGNPNFDISEGITGKGISSYFTPNATANKAGEFDISKPTSDTSANAMGQNVTGQNKTAGQQAADKAKEGFTMEKFNKIVKAMQVATTKKAPQISPRSIQSHATRFGSQANFQNPLAQRDFQSIYMNPSIKSHWGSY